MVAPAQDKQKEITFFDRPCRRGRLRRVRAAGERSAWSTRSCELTGLQPGARVADLGCGSGTFTALLARAGYDCVGLDISAKLIAVGRRKYPDIEFLEGDIEQLPFPDASFDGVLLSGVVHHFPDPSRCAAEVFRVLRPQGRFVAFDPNRMNPFMWLYRDRASPFYSPLGVTENERPVLAREVAAVFERTGFTRVLALSLRPRLSLRGLAAGAAAAAGLQLHRCSRVRPGFMERLRPFVLTAGDANAGVMR